MKAKKSTTFRIAAAGVAAATMMSLAPAANAQIMIPTSSEGHSSMVPVYLPDNVVADAERLGIPLPSFLVNPDTLKNLGIELEGKTNVHLARSGHTSEAEAIYIAREWATQAARGEATFHGNVGRGTTHLDKGDGNIYRLTAQQARDRLVWLERETNRAPDGKRFGTASSNDGTYVYLVEYFLN